MAESLSYLFLMEKQHCSSKDRCLIRAARGTWNFIWKQATLVQECTSEAHLNRDVNLCRLPDITTYSIEILSALCRHYAAAGVWWTMLLLPDKSLWQASTTTSFASASIYLIEKEKVIALNITENMSLLEKLTILSDAAKYDVACTSSGVDRKGNGHGMGIPLLPESAIPSLPMDAVFPCLRFFLPMNAFSAVPTARITATMMCQGLPLHRTKSVPLPWNFTAEIILKVFS